MLINCYQGKSMFMISIKIRRRARVNEHNAPVAATWANDVTVIGAFQITVNRAIDMM